MAQITHVKSARERRNPDGTPKPLLRCDKCNNVILVGSPYKHMSRPDPPVHESSSAARRRHHDA